MQKSQRRFTPSFSQTTASALRIITLYVESVLLGPTPVNCCRYSVILPLCLRYIAAFTSQLCYCLIFIMAHPAQWRQQSVSQASLSCSWCELLSPVQSLAHFLFLYPTSLSSAIANSPGPRVLLSASHVAHAWDSLSILRVFLFQIHSTPLLTHSFPLSQPIHCSDDVIGRPVYVFVKQDKNILCIFYRIYCLMCARLPSS